MTDVEDAAESNAQLTFRRATVDDIEQMVARRVEMQTSFGVRDAVDWSNGNRAYFERKIPTGDFVAFLCEAGGEIVATSGMIMYETPPRPANPNGLDAYIINMYTIPEHRGHGIAAELVRRLIEHAESVGAGRVWLKTSDMGRSVYAKAGFVEDGSYMKLSLV